METKFEMVAKTFQGLEDVLRDELIDLGAENVEIGTRMVTFEGDNEMLYKANLCCRTALRILKPIVKFTAADTDELYDKVRDLNWEQFMDLDTTFAIDTTVSGEDFTHSRYVTYRVKDGIADHFNDNYGKRPSIRLQGADLLLNVHIAGERVTISLDSSGEPLYKRGYREAQTEAPINEVLAAGIILKTGWRGDSDFLDPMCGSGTFLVEAALIAANINPGIYRESFAFEKWKDFDSELFEEIYNDDSAEREFAYKIYGGDIDPDAVMIARKNVKSAKVEDMVEIVCRPMAEWTENAPEGILVTNPPYGERLVPENISSLYRGIGTTLKNYFAGWHAWILGMSDDRFAEIGLKPSVKIPLLNGNLECTLREYVMFDGKYSEFRADGGSVANKDMKSGAPGPKKVKHISDDDWVKESKKFNAGKGFKDERKKTKPFNRNDKKQADYVDNGDDDMGGYEEMTPGGGNFRQERNGGNFRKEAGNFRKEGSNFRKEGGNFRKESGNFRKESGNFRKEGGGFRKNDGNFRKEGGKFRKDGGNRVDYRDERHRGGSFNRDNRSGGGRVNYDPSRSHGPRISKDNEQVLNPVHFRQRKRREENDNED